MLDCNNFLRVFKPYLPWIHGFALNTSHVIKNFIFLASWLQVITFAPIYRQFFWFNHITKRKKERKKEKDRKKERRGQEGKGREGRKEGKRRRTGVKATFGARNCGYTAFLKRKLVLLLKANIVMKNQILKSLVWYQRWVISLQEKWLFVKILYAMKITFEEKL